MSTQNSEKTGLQSAVRNQQCRWLRVLARVAHLLGGLVGCHSENGAHVVTDTHELPGLILDVAGLSAGGAAGMVHHDAGVGECVALTLCGAAHQKLQQRNKCRDALIAQCSLHGAEETEAGQPAP